MFLFSIKSWEVCAGGGTLLLTMLLLFWKWIRLLAIIFARCCNLYIWIFLSYRLYSWQSFYSDLFNSQSLPHRTFPSLTSACKARATRMSQLQFPCPASPMPAASAPMQLGQPQPSYSIPCATGALASESASQPVRTSALPAGSATPYNTTTGGFY